MLELYLAPRFRRKAIVATWLLTCLGLVLGWLMLSGRAGPVGFLMAGALIFRVTANYLALRKNSPVVKVYADGGIWLRTSLVGFDVNRRLAPGWSVRQVGLGLRFEQEGIRKARLVAMYFSPEDLEVILGFSAAAATKGTLATDGLTAVHKILLSRPYAQRMLIVRYALLGIMTLSIAGTLWHPLNAWLWAAAVLALVGSIIALLATQRPVVEVFADGTARVRRRSWWPSWVNLRVGWNAALSNRQIALMEQGIERAVLPIAALRSDGGQLQELLELAGSAVLSTRGTDSTDGSP